MPNTAPRPRLSYSQPGSDILIFANPIAGRGRGQAIAEQLEARLSSDGYAVHIYLDRTDEIDICSVHPNASAAIVIGGDGTLRSVAECIFQRHNEGPALLIVPMGTANLMGRHLGIDWDTPRFEDQVVAALKRRKVMRVDTASANGRLFLLMAGIGIDAHIVHELDKRRTGPINYASYVLPGALALHGYRYPPLTVSVDGKKVSDEMPGMAFVGNIKEYGTGFPILPHARPDDGLLDVCVMPCANRPQAIQLLLYAAAGEHLQADGVVYLKGKHVEVTSPEPVAVQVDGDAAGHTPLVIDLLPVRVPFIVPA